MKQAISIIIIITLAISWVFIIEYKAHLPYEKAKVVFENGIEVIAEIANTREQQSLGLGGREELVNGEGMLFPYTPASTERFWMKGMKIPIDIIWLAKGEIVGIEPSLQPPHSDTEILKVYTSPTQVDYVLEVPSGFATENGLILGTKFEVK